MARKIFLTSIILCLLCIGLSQTDPGTFGLHEEPERIAFYGGTGLLAGFSGFVALLSGVYLGLIRFAGLSTGQRRLLVITLGVLLGAVVSVAVLRFTIFR